MSSAKETVGALQALWVQLHCIAKNLPALPSEDHLRVFRSHVRDYTVLLWCGCSRQLRRDLDANSELGHLLEAVKSREQAQQFVWRLHNRVNQLTGKPALSYDDAMTQQQVLSRIPWTQEVLSRNRGPLDQGRRSEFDTTSASATATATALAQGFAWRNVAMFFALVVVALFLLALMKSKR